MADVLIPGDELERLSGLLNTVRDTVGKMGELDTLIGGNPTTAVGDLRLLRAVNGFHDHWSDGHYQLRKETKSLSESADGIVKAVRDTDTELGKALTDPEGTKEKYS